MKIPHKLKQALFITLLQLISFNTIAQTQGSVQDIIGGATGKADKSYASVGIAMNEFRSVKLIVVERVDKDDGSFREVIHDELFPLTAQTYSVMATVGTYISNHFKTEIRTGGGVRSDTLNEILELNIKYWFSWYIGATYPITDYMSAYAMYGVSHYAADVTRKEAVQFFAERPGFPEKPITVLPSILQSDNPKEKRMFEDLFGTSFSTSWLLGFDLKLTNDLFLAFEYGRLLRDEDTDIRVYQGSTSLRYEF